MKVARLGFVVASLLAAALPAQSSPFAVKLAAQLKKHPFFTRVSFEVDESRERFLLWLQASLDRNDTEYARRVLNSLHPFMKKLVEVFETEYCVPNGLTQREPNAPFAVAILASRGLYDDYARATDSPSLHSSLAHYNPDLQLAVTYRESIADHGQWEERQSLLHELVHALQHAYSTTGAMPKPLWFNEGLAEYRSACTHMTASLAEPPLHEHHLQAMAHARVRANGKLLLPIQDLVVPESYVAVVQAIQKQAGAVDGDFALGMFYAQAEMTVRFLHEAAAGKYRPGFQRYFHAVQSGGTGTEAFAKAFAITDAAGWQAMQNDWDAWLNQVFERRYPSSVDASGKGLEKIALPPPSTYDPAALAWQADETAARMTAIRRLCAQGEFERAMQALPASLKDATANNQVTVERKRVQALLTLRDRVIADAKKSATVNLGGVRGKLLRCEGNTLVVQTGKTESRITCDAAVLLEWGLQRKAFEGVECWQEAWLRWLTGAKRDAHAALWTRNYSPMQDLQRDLSTDLTPDYGVEALALEELQQMRPPDDRPAATAMLRRAQQLVRHHGPLMARRKAGVEQLVKALAERAFGLDDPAALGIRGKVTALDDGRIRVEYSDPKSCPDCDFTTAPKDALNLNWNLRVRWDGSTQLQAQDRHWQLIGDGKLRWAVPLAGKQKITLDFQRGSEQGSFLVAFCAAPGRSLLAWPSGTATIHDPLAGIVDLGTAQEVEKGKTSRLEIEHDGERNLVVKLNGQKTAESPAVGSFHAGELLLWVRSTSPIWVLGMTIEGKLAPDNPVSLRDRYAARVLGGLWQAEAAPEPVAAAKEDVGRDEVVPAWHRGAKLEPNAQRAVDAALDWLVRHQDPDGKWDNDGFMKNDRKGEACDGPGHPQNDVGVTGLALLALLADGNTLRHGPHQAAVRSGIDWLIHNQDADRGTFASMQYSHHIYDQAIATLAVAEAAGVHGDTRLRTAAQLGINYLESHRNPYSVWRYWPRDNDNSTSVTAFCYHAYWTAETIGLEVNRDAISLVRTWFDQISDSTGLHGYTKQGEPSSRRPGDHSARFPIEKGEAMTGAGLFCRFLLRQNPKDVPLMGRAADLILAKPPVWDPKWGTIDEIYWYWASQAMAQMGGKFAIEWRKKLLAATLGTQRNDGNFAGSWDPIGVWGEESGRVGTTALLALAILAPKRYGKL